MGATRRDWIIAMVVFLVGLTVGGEGVGGYYRFHEKRTAEVFSRRFQCNGLASRYTKKESSDTQAVYPQMVGYSTVSNSCVAYFQVREYYGPRAKFREWRVIDLLSDEELYTGECDDGSPPYADVECGNGNNVMFSRRSEVAFHQAISGKKINVDRVK
jgi:hypothetical protein